MAYVAARGGNKSSDSSSHMRVLSPAAERRVGHFYSATKFSVAGGIGGIAIVDTIEKIVGSLHLPGINWIAMALGAIAFLVIARHYKAE